MGPDGAEKRSYGLGDYIFVDLRLKFGWRRIPGWWGDVASAMQDVKRKATKESAVLVHAGKEAKAHVKGAGRTERTLKPVPIVGC